MGFMDKAKKLAEQAQEKLDEAQKNFNEKQGSGSQPADGGVRYDEHGRPIAGGDARRGHPAAQRDAAAGSHGADRGSGSACRSRSADAPAGGANATPDPFKPIEPVTERFSRDMRLGGILTAMVTPFDSKGDLDEDATARLVRHLLENGSDGLVLAGSTGEGATMTDEEKVRLWEIGVAESGDAPIIAGTGTYDTRHSVELTERAHETGVDAMLVVTPYYVRPNRRGIKAHYEAVAAATDRPIVAYNIPSRTATDMPNDLLAELAADIDNVAGREAGPLRGHGADRGHGPARRQRRRARQGDGHGRHRRDLRGLEPDRRARCGGSSTSPTAATRSRTSCATSTRRCP